MVHGNAMQSAVTLIKAMDALGIDYEDETNRVRTNLHAVNSNNGILTIHDSFTLYLRIHPFK